MYALDFETCDSDTVDHTREIDGEQLDIYEQRVWLAGIMDLSNYGFNAFTNINDIMQHILNLHSNKITHIFIHNLGFDGTYIIPWLEENGFTNTDRAENVGEYSAFIDNKSNWYNIKIKHKKQGSIEIYDTTKLFAMALAELPNVYDTPTRKLKESQEFYTRKREVNHTPDKEELAYIYNDTRVIAETLNAHIDIYGENFKKTTASQSWHEMKKAFPFWRERFPAISEPFDVYMRKCYSGGITYLNPAYQGLLIEETIYSLDIQSSFPSRAAYGRVPQGDGTLHIGNNAPAMGDGTFWVARALIWLKLKPNCVPCIPSFGLEYDFVNYSEKPSTWIKETEGYEILTFTSEDFKNIKLSYDYEIIEWYEHVWFRNSHQKEIREFIESNNEKKLHAQREMEKAKEVGDIQAYAHWKSERLRYKTINNSFYGKFGERITRVNKGLLYDGDKLRLKNKEPVTNNMRGRKYLPWALSVTAQARHQLLLLANALGEHLIYTDTDSVFFTEEGLKIVWELAENGTIEVDNEKLGAWAGNGSFKRGKFLRPKCYMVETHDGELLSTVAGLPAEDGRNLRSYLDFDNFNMGAVIPPEVSGKLQSIRTRTGTKLIPVGFEIKEDLGAM